MISIADNPVGHIRAIKEAKDTSTELNKENHNDTYGYAGKGDEHIPRWFALKSGYSCGRAGSDWDGE